MPHTPQVIGPTLSTDPSTGCACRTGTVRRTRAVAHAPAAPVARLDVPVGHERDVQAADLARYSAAVASGTVVALQPIVPILATARPSTSASRRYQVLWNRPYRLVA